MQPHLASGDRVVALAGLLTSAAAIAGGISCAIALWIIKRSVWWSIAAIIIGTLVGIGIGLVAGSFVFPAAPGKVFVVKLGPEALPLTLKAGLIGAVISGLTVCVVPAGILGQFSKLGSLAAVGFAVGISIGALIGYLSVRL